MDGFAQEVVRRLPLAMATLQTFDYAFEPAMLDSIYEDHRGRSYTVKLEFHDLLRITRDCLLVHESGHRGMMEARDCGTLPVNESSVYRKLSRVPLNVSEALLRCCTQRLTELLPTESMTPLPACFDAYEPIAFDGKKLKNAAKRLGPCRGYAGKLLGGKMLVATSVRGGLALAMHGSQDGEANDVPLIPGLLPQVRAVIDKPALWIGDRQFGDLATPSLLAGERDGYLIRIRANLKFTPSPDDPARIGVDHEGRAFTDQLGHIGSGKRRLAVRRIEIQLDGEPLILITNLTDAAAFPAADLLGLYRRRWGIEQVFQQITEQFDLRHLIGSTPRAILFQASFCLLLYNLMQVLKAYVALDGEKPVREVSTHHLLVDVKKSLTAWFVLAPMTPPPAAPRDAASMKQRLLELTRGTWRKLWTKKSDQNPRKKRQKPTPLHGGHTSVYRLLQQAKAAQP